MEASLERATRRPNGPAEGRLTRGWNIGAPTPPRRGNTRLGRRLEKLESEIREERIQIYADILEPFIILFANDITLPGTTVRERWATGAAQDQG